MTMPGRRGSVPEEDIFTPWNWRNFARHWSQGQHLLPIWSAREQADRKRNKVALDIGDESVVRTAKSGSSSRQDRDTRLLREVREALQRIKTRTYGRCLDDGEYRRARLEAVPGRATA